MRFAQAVPQHSSVPVRQYSQLAAGIMLPGLSRSTSGESTAVGTMDEVDTRRADSNKQASTTYSYLYTTTG